MAINISPTLLIYYVPVYSVFVSYLLILWLIMCPYNVLKCYILTVYCFKPKNMYFLLCRQVIFDVCGRLLCIHHGRFHEAGYTRTPPPPSHEHTPCIDAGGKSDNTQGARSSMAESNHNKMAADKQWRLVAFILDRLFCILFLIIDVIVLVIYFPT